MAADVVVADAAAVDVVEVDIMKQLESLPAEVTGKLESFCRTLQASLGEGLVSITLYGSGARGTYSFRESDLNLLLVIQRADMASLAVLRLAITALGEGLRVAPYLVTRAELPQMVRAFPTRVMEMKRGHVVLAGEDVLAELAVDRAELAQRCHQEMLNLLMRFRHCLLGKVDADALEADVRAYLPPLVKTLRSLLFVRTGEYTELRDDVLRAAARHFGLPEATLLQFGAWRSGRVEFTATEWDEASAAFLEVLQRVTETADV